MQYATVSAALAACLVLAHSERARAQSARVSGTNEPTSSMFIASGEVAFEPVLGGLSGRRDSNGLVPTADDVATTNLFLDGTVALGTRGLGLSGLDSYFLGRGRFDLADGAPLTGQFSHPDVVHRSAGGTLWLHQAYASIDRFASSGFLSHAYLRAGRQSHYTQGIGLTFDGVTAGYDDDTLRVMGRVGARSAVYDRTHSANEFLDGGLVVGGEIGYDFRTAAGTAVDVWAEVLHHRRTIRLIAREQALFGDAGAIQDQTTAGHVVIDWAVTQAFFISSRLVFAFPSVSFVRASAQYAPTSDMQLTLDFEQKVGRGLFYDFGALRGLLLRGRRTTYESLRLNMVDPQSYSDLGFEGLFVPAGWFSINVRLGGRLASGAEEEQSLYDASQVRYGLTAMSTLRVGRRASLEITVGGDGWLYLRPNGEEGTFRGVAGGGERLVQDAQAGLRWVFGSRWVGRRLLSPRRVSIGVSGFLRWARLDNQFLLPDEAVTELIGGGLAEFRWDHENFGLRVAYEYARDSRAILNHLTDLHAVGVRVRGSL